MDCADNLDELLARKRTLDARIAAAPALAQRLHELRSWQARRLARTYEDLAREPRHAAAVEFFLSDLYGSAGAARRDQDLRRAWRHFKRALPHAAFELIERAVTLDVLTAELDVATAERLAARPVTTAAYVEAYRRVNRAEERRRQIDLTIAVGLDLDRIVRHAWIGIALKAAHIPAHTAGYGALQDFLERGFSAFRKMRGAGTLLAAIRERETQMMHSLLAGTTPPSEKVGTKASTPS